MSTTALVLFVCLGSVMLLVGGIIFRNGLTLFFAPDEQFRAAANNGPATPAEALTGNTDPYKSHRRDHAMAAGLARDSKGQFIPQGRLSDEMVDNLI